MNISSNSIFSNITPVVKHLLLINIILEVARNVMIYSGTGIDLNDILGLHFWQSDKFHIYQLFTYMFMHGGFTHIFFNMFNLWMFGNLLERIMGSKRFLFFYIVCGLGAGLVQEVTWQMSWQNIVGSMLADENGHQIVLTGNQVAEAIKNHQISPSLLQELLDNMVTVGASGAIFGIMLAFAWFFPNIPLYLFFIPIPIKAKYMIFFYGAIELFFGIHGVMDNVAHFAHLGGLLFGLIILIYWKRRGTLSNNYGY